MEIKLLFLAALVLLMRCYFVAEISLLQKCTCDLCVCENILCAMKVKGSGFLWSYKIIYIQPPFFPQN